MTRRLSAPLFSLVVGMALIQDFLLYFPEQAPLAALEREGLRAWPERQAFRGLVAEPAGRVRGTVVVFHGNAGHAGQREVYAIILTALHYRVILAEYPGYGPRPGGISESELVEDARETVRLAHQNYAPPLIVMGESLGAAVAAGATARHADHVAGLLLITPWDRLEEVARHHYPWLPVSWLMRDHYDTAAYLAGFRRRVAVVLAERDSVVPFQSGLGLYRSLAATKRLLIVGRSDHNDWLAGVDAAWWSQLLDFLSGTGTE